MTVVKFLMYLNTTFNMYMFFEYLYLINIETKRKDIEYRITHAWTLILCAFIVQFRLKSTRGQQTSYQRL